MPRGEDAGEGTDEASAWPRGSVARVLGAEAALPLLGPLGGAGGSLGTGRLPPRPSLQSLEVSAASGPL